MFRWLANLLGGSARAQARHEAIVAQVETQLKSFGSRLMAALSMPVRGYAPMAAAWTDSRIEQTRHFKYWTYCAIKAKCQAIAGLTPNVSIARPLEPGKRTKGWLNVPMRRKAWTNIKPHEDLEPVEDNHALVQLFRDPNDPDTPWQLWYETILYLELTGNAYWWIPPNGWGLPSELWCIPAHWVYPMTRGRAEVESYQIRPVLGSAIMVELPAEDVIHIKYPSPISKIDGYSPLTANARWVDTGESIDLARWSQFKNGAQPGVAINLSPDFADPTEEDIERITARFVNKFVGETKVGKPLILSPGMELQPLTINPTEMAYVQSAEQLRDFILAAHGVPRAIVMQPDGMTYGSVAAVMTGFCTFTLKPILTLLGQVLTEKLARRFDSRVRVWWADPSPDDPAQALSERQAAFAAGAITPNEWRQALGLEPYEYGGDDPLLPMSLSPVPLNTGDKEDALAMFPDPNAGMGGMPGMGGEEMPPEMGGEEEGEPAPGEMPEEEEEAVSGTSGLLDLLKSRGTNGHGLHPITKAKPDCPACQCEEGPVVVAKGSRAATDPRAQRAGSKPAAPQVGAPAKPQARAPKPRTAKPRAGAKPVRPKVSAAAKPRTARPRTTPKFTGERRSKPSSRFPNGMRMCYVDGKRVACPRPEKQPRQKIDHHQAAEHLQGLLAQPDKITAEHIGEAAEYLSQLSVAELTQLKKKMGVRASGYKAELVKKIAERVLGPKKAAPKPPAEEIPHENEISAGSGPDEQPVAEDSPPVEEEAGGSDVQGDGGERESEDQPAPKESARRVPARVEQVGRRLDRYEKLFRARGNHKLADWMGMLREHVNAVGVEAALDALGPEVEGAGETVQYGGHDLDGNGDADFIEAYLSRAGISLIEGTAPKGRERAISTVTASSDEEGLHARGDPNEGASDFFPKLQTLRDKLDEAQHLPGLEASEDLSKLMGGEFGARVPQFTPEVLKKLDETYGEGKWIVKSYGDEAYAGYGIFFPQRVAQLQKDAREAIWASGAELAKYGFSHLRDEGGKVIGIKHSGGDEYRFGTPEYEKTIQGDARRAGDQAAAAAASESGAAIPEGRFMAQPAFPVVGVSNEERAQGVTFKRGGEGRVHVVTRDGKAELVPHSTWLKQEPLPVVFEDDRTRAMAQAAVDAINALPESERRGQIYAPDIVETADGFRVVEANPANEAGASGYLQDNPFVMDSYVSHMVGREPAHVSFIRRLLTSRGKGGE